MAVKDFENNRLSLELFHSTNLVEKYDEEKLKEGKFVTKYNDDGYPILNEIQSAIRFNNYLNTNVKQLRTNPQNKIRVYKVNDPNTPKDINDNLLATIEAGGGSTEEAYGLVMTDLRGEPIKVDGQYVYTFLPTRESGISKLAEVGSVLRYLKTKNSRTTLDLVRSYKEKDKYVLNNIEYTWDELVKLSREFNVQVYDKFLAQVNVNLPNGVILSVADVTNGYVIKQKVKTEDGLTTVYKYQNPLPILSSKLGSDKIGTKDNKVFGFRIEQANNTNSVPSSKSYVPAGRTVMVLDNGDVIQIRGVKLENSKTAVDTILHLISLANVDQDGKYGLKNLKVKLPNNLKENGQTHINVFGNDGLLSRLIYWGKNPNSPNEIYIDNGEIVFKKLGPDGYRYTKLSINDVKNEDKNKELVEFLKTRHLQLNKVFLNRPSTLIYFHPVFKNGKLDFEYVTGYQNYLFQNNLIESSIADNKNPDTKDMIFANKNIIFAENNEGIPIISNFKAAPAPTTNSLGLDPSKKIEIDTSDLGDLMDLESEAINSTVDSQLPLDEQIPATTGETAASIMSVITPQEVEKKQEDCETGTASEQPSQLTRKVKSKNNKLKR